MTHWIKELKRVRSEEAARLNIIDFGALAWFVLRVAPHAMLSTAIALRAIDYQALYPVTRQGKRRHRSANPDERTIVTAETLPGYLFLGASRDVNWLAVRDLKHVYSVLGTNGVPMRCRSREVYDIMYADILDTSYDRELKEVELSVRKFEKDDRVVINEGPFRGLEGFVLGFDKKGDAEIELINASGVSFSSLLIRPGMADKSA